MKRDRAKRYVKLVEWSAADGCYIGTCPGLMLGGVHGDDEKKVYKELCDAVEEVIALKERHGDPLPRPLAGKEFSGRFVLRINPGLHKLLALRALKEGDSLNNYLAKKLEKVA